MKELHIYNTLKEAWETSTLNNNRFSSAIDSYQWDNQFFADDEYYFIKGGFCFATPTLDPFDERSTWWEPSAKFSDGSLACF